MVVPSKLQDLLETITPESSASSSAHGNSGYHHSSPSKSSSSERTSSDGEGMGEGASNPPTKNVEASVLVLVEWEGKTISGRLSNLRKAPQTLPARFRFKATLHHEVADGAASIKGYKKLEEIVRQYHILRIILI
ncbi:hypothetical protein SLA2020_002880 [Shorea laevis]